MKKMSIVLFMLTLMLSANINASMTDKSTKFCMAKWPTNYSMQEYCRKRQVKGINGMLDFAAKNGKGTAGYYILARCHKRWKPNYRMTMYCTERQQAAYRGLKK